MRRIPTTLCALALVGLCFSSPAAASRDLQPRTPQPRPQVVAPPRKPVAVSGGVAVTVQVLSTPPQRFANSLGQNYPNPFGSWTVFRYSLARPSRVSVTVFNIAGQKVATLVDGYQNPGVYTMTWDGRGNDGRHVASGVYLYRVIAPGFTQTRKLIVTR